jgi:hypothetical protein
MVPTYAPLNTYRSATGESRQLVAVTSRGLTTVVDERLDGHDAKPVAEGLATLDQLVAACVDHLAAHAADPVAF